MRPQDDPANNLASAEKARLAAQARRNGASWAQAAEVSGYASKGAAHHAVTQAYRKEREHLRHSLEELRQIEDDRDDDLRRKLHMIIASPHPVLYQGVAVRDADGNPLQDAGPVLAAIDRLGRIADRYALRHGLNAAKELHIALEQRTDAEAATVADVVFAIVDELGLPPDMRLSMLDAAQRRLEAAAAEAVQQVPEE